jgi:hypothetical protein
MRTLAGLNRLRIEPVVSCFEQYTELSDFIKGGEFLDQPGEYQFLKRDSASWNSLCR